MAIAPSNAQTPGSAGHALTAASTVSRRHGGSGPRDSCSLRRAAARGYARRSEGSLRSGGDLRLTTLYSVNPGFADSNHDAVMRIGGRLLGGGSILQKRH